MMAEANLVRGRLVCAVRSGLVICGGLLCLNACQNPPPPFANLPRLKVSTQFGVENLCDIGVSPRISLSNVPPSTKTYVVKMTNIDVLIQTPWREVIPTTSKAEISEGAGKTFVGPCFGDNTRFPPTAPYGYRYRVEVLAEDGAGKPLAYGSIIVPVQSPYLTARRMRLEQGGGPQNGKVQPSPAQSQRELLPDQGYGFSPDTAPNLGLLQ